MSEKDPIENYPWIFRKGNTLTFDSDLMPPEMEEETLKFISEANGFPMFKGDGHHAYRLTAAKNSGATLNFRSRVVVHIRS